MEINFCKLFWHKYCNCGWCLGSPICLRCYWNPITQKHHKSLHEGMLFQEQHYKKTERKNGVTNA